ncbi:MAG TPA: O-antigen ligase family protein [Stellaceae bacterium]|nr:O-antigen ligase family protein [Stellaceae bacterium]
MPALRRACEAGLDACAFLLPPLLAVVPRGAAALVGVAGLCAAGLVAASPPRRFAGLRLPAALIAALLLWALLSAAWSITPWRSLVLELRLAGLAAAALALAAAAGRVAAPRRLAACLFAGSALGIGLALYDLASAGGLARYVTVRPFAAPRLNSVAAWLTLFLLPAGALLLCRGRAVLAALAALGVGAAVGLLDDTSAKLALGLSLPVAALVYWRPAAVTRVAAVAAALAILTAPVTLPRLAHSPALFARVDAFKNSAGHRLLIWSFTGDRIAERPLLGWGLDTARAIPGGKVEIRPGQDWLPLHPHDAALQVWLELGAPGAALTALLVGLLWLRLGAAAWPRLYRAASGGSLAAALAIAGSGWGIWEEWWLATLALALFAVSVMARVAITPPPPPRGWPGGGR